MWRPSNGLWYVLNTTTGIQSTRAWGQSGDVPVPGDYDGDGRTDYAVWRPSTGPWPFNTAIWCIAYSNGNPPVQRLWGQAGDIPVPADYDGDDRTDLAVWRPSNTTWYIAYGNGRPPVQQQWGQPGDIPVPGSVDALTGDEYRIFRPSRGQWWTRGSTPGHGPDEITGFGRAGDVPSTARFDCGCGGTGLYRPSTGTWHVIENTDPASPEHMASPAIRRAPCGVTCGPNETFGVLHRPEWFTSAWPPPRRRAGGSNRSETWPGASLC